ncbi:MAG: AMP-binding protein [Deltaproteobacteria bacterium]|nr:AMP-binding protein [Deltaproteobacteria bacterium]
MNNFTEHTIGGLLEDVSSRFPEQDALVFPERGIRLSYRDFYLECERVAKGFMALGVKQGDHVSVWTTNLPEWVYMQFGLGMIGAVLVTVNTNYRSSELEYILSQSDSTTLVFMEESKGVSFYETVMEVIPGLEDSMPGKIEHAGLPLLKNLVYIGDRQETPGMFRFDDLLEMGKSIEESQLEERQRSLDSHDTINIQYTSGTTGFPKGVMLSHYNIINNGRMVGDVMGMGPGDRLLIYVPLFHCFGCVLSALNCVSHASAMVVMEIFDALKALEFVHRERCTAINGVPTMFMTMLNHERFKDYDMASLRTGIMAGAPCPVDVMRRVTAEMHCPEVVIAYGQTECAPVMTMTRRDDSQDIRVSTVGRLLPGIEGRIVDPDTNRELPADEQGEIVTRGPCVMNGYYKMEEETAKAIDNDGWLHTGDLGKMDINGNFQVTGRIKEMVIRGGENIYPREIEEFLHPHPMIDDVYVVGIPDKKYGEELLAVVRLNEGEDITAQDFIDFCAGKIARHKIPKRWEFVDEFPMTASGKVQKFKLVEEYLARHPGD